MKYIQPYHVHFRFLKFLPGRCCGAWSLFVIIHHKGLILAPFSVSVPSKLDTHWNPLRNHYSRLWRPALRISASLDLDMMPVHLHFWQVLRLCQCYCLQKHRFWVTAQFVTKIARLKLNLDTVGRLITNMNTVFAPLWFLFKQREC